MNKIDKPRSSIHSSPTAGPSNIELKKAPTRASKRRRVDSDSGTTSKDTTPTVPVAQRKFSRRKLKASLLANKAQVITAPEPAPLTPASMSDSKEADQQQTNENAELESLRVLLKEQEQTIKEQRQLLTSINNQLQCQICLDSLTKPYALVPCGHVSCLDCLKKWFTTTIPNSEEDAFWPARVQTRSKTCPQCRARVMQRPVAVFLIKDVASHVNTFFNPESAVKREAPLEADPWEGIFPTARHGANRGMDGAIFDHEDGGIRRCSVCLHEVTGRRCTGCGEEFDHSDEESDFDPEALYPLAGVMDHEHFLGAMPWFERQRAALEEEISDEGEYESSFIDDDEDEEVPRIEERERFFRQQEVDEERSVIVLSDESDASAPIVQYGRRGVPTWVIPDDEDEDEEEGHSPGYLSHPVPIYAHQLNPELYRRETWDDEDEEDAEEAHRIRLALEGADPWDDHPGYGRESSEEMHFSDHTLDDSPVHWMHEEHDELFY